MVTYFIDDLQVPKPDIPLTYEKAAVAQLRIIGAGDANESCLERY